MTTKRNCINKINRKSSYVKQIASAYIKYILILFAFSVCVVMILAYVYTITSIQKSKVIFGALIPFLILCILLGAYIRKRRVISQNIDALVIGSVTSLCILLLIFIITKQWMHLSFFVLWLSSISGIRLGMFIAKMWQGK